MGIERTKELQGKIELKITEAGKERKDEFLGNLFAHLSKKASAFQSNGAKVKSISFMMKDMPMHPDMNFNAVLYLDIGSHVRDLSFGSYDSEKVYLKQLLDYIYSEAKGFQAESVKVSHFSIQTV